MLFFLSDESFNYYLHFFSTTAITTEIIRMKIRITRTMIRIRITEEILMMTEIHMMMANITIEIVIIMTIVRMIRGTIMTTMTEIGTQTEIMSNIGWIWNARIVLKMPICSAFFKMLINWPRLSAQSMLVHSGTSKQMSTKPHNKNRFVNCPINLTFNKSF